MDNHEVAREGNRELAKFLGVSLKTAWRLAKEMRLTTGIVWKRRMRRKSKKTGKWCYSTVNVWFPSRVLEYMAVRQMKIDDMWKNN